MGKKNSDRTRAFLCKKDCKCKKCVVCGKALRYENETGLCSSDLSRERVLCYYHQGIYNHGKRRNINRKRNN